MSLKRSLNFLSESYNKNYYLLPDTEQSISSDIVIESTCTNTDELITELPTSIILSAQMIPSFISHSCYAQRIDDKIRKDPTNIYSNPLFDQNSQIKSMHNVINSISIVYENSGEIIFNNQSHKFYGNSCDFFEIQNLSSQQTLFEKKFITQHNDILLNFSNNALEPHKESIYNALHAYGGFFSYTSHPMEIEQCLMQLSSNKNNTTIKISKINAWHNINFTQNTPQKLSDNSHMICFDKVQDTISLYENIKLGSCKITLLNNQNNTSHIYTSDAVTHVQNTNLIMINFKKENTQ